MTTATVLDVLDEQALIEFVRGRRWYGSKTQEIAHAAVLDAAVLRSQTPLLVAALVEIRFGPGTHETYQLLLGVRPADEGWEQDRVAEADGWTVYDALADEALAREIASLMRADAAVQSAEGVVELRAVSADFGDDLGPARPVGVEQSNSSVVFGDSLILKAYRRLEAGVNPELEVLRFLTELGFGNIASLVGWYSYSGRPLDATLGVLQAYLPDARDGWELAVEALRAEPDSFLTRVRRLGEVTGELHTALAADPHDPDFAPEQPSAEAISLLTASVDEEIEEIFRTLPESESLEPITGRGEEVRERLRLISHVGAVGRVIRHHGDYHLGQVLWSKGDWHVLDFEGEPARSLPERRRKRSPLRDVAGMLRSFAYVASASEITHGESPPPDWEQRAREDFLAGYYGTVDSSLLPPGQDARDKLLAVFELEKAVYELRYELNNRPDWVRIPVAGILRLLE